jgi:UDP-N-acetyl-D-glucosamine/UDP-N-acetyl-D-galactosamine dehydrogenase
VPDLRNSRVPDIIHELADFGIEVLVHDPIATPAEAMHEYQVELQNFEKLTNLDAIVLAVAHTEYNQSETLLAKLKDNAVLIDVKSLFKPNVVGASQTYWSL